MTQELNALVAQVKTWRDEPNQRDPEHRRKWNQVLATLGIDSGEGAMPAETIRYRARRWPDSRWAVVAEYLDANPDAEPEPEPAGDDPVRDLAEEIYVDYINDAIDRRHHQQAAALEALGFSDWILGGQSYTSPETVRRRGKILAKLSSKPYFARFASMMEATGWRYPRRHLPRRVEPLKPFCKVTNVGGVLWGLAESKDRDLQFRRSYDRLYLKVLDGGEEVASLESTSFSNSTTLERLGLEDDDYRFEVGCRADRGWTRFGKWFDWAVVDGEWTELPYQGREWDGEWIAPSEEDTAA